MELPTKLFRNVKQSGRNALSSVRIKKKKIGKKEMRKQR